MDDTRPDPTDQLVTELLRAFGCLAQIVSHMERSAPHASPDAPPPDVILRRLLTGTLLSVREARGPAAVEAAASLLSDCVEAIADDIVLVPLDGARPPGALRPSATGRQPPRRRRR